jgi:hypothetical protein
VVMGQGLRREVWGRREVGERSEGRALTSEAEGCATGGFGLGRRVLGKRAQRAAQPSNIWTLSKMPRSRPGQRKRTMKTHCSPLSTAPSLATAHSPAPVAHAQTMPRLAARLRRQGCTSALGIARLAHLAFRPTTCLSHHRMREPSDCSFQNIRAGWPACLSVLPAHVALTATALPVRP